MKNIKNLHQEEIDKNYLKLCFEGAKASPAEKRKVGAIIVDHDNEIISTGFNRMFSKFPSKCENHQGKSFECVVHAEEQAIIDFFEKQEQFDYRPYNTTIYCSYSPCMNCCKLIVHAYIKRLVYCNEHPVNFKTPEIENGYSPLDFLEQIGVEVIRYPYESLNQVKEETIKDDCLTKAITDFKKQYPNITSVDLQAFTLGYQSLITGILIHKKINNI